jgi:cytochrome c-type biogenesis protein CcmH
MFHRTWRYTQVMAVVLIFGAFTALAACTTSASPLSKDEQRAQSLDQSLVCPICPGETIDRSQVQLATQMKVILREQIQEGRTDAEIRQFFVDRYGERVLASPPKEGFNLLMWIAPPVGVALALLVLLFVTRSMMQRSPTSPTLSRGSSGDSKAEDGLDEYLALVDVELGEAEITGKQPGTIDRANAADTEGN